MGDLTPMDVVERRADDSRCPTYRRAADGTVEHRCCACGKWLPGTLAYFGFAGPNGADVRGFRSRCRDCEPRESARRQRRGEQAPKPPEPARRARPPIPDPVRPIVSREVLEESWFSGERTCRVCGVTQLLDPDLWALRHDGAPSSVCRLCKDGMQASLAARGRRPWETQDAAPDGMDGMDAADPND